MIRDRYRFWTGSAEVERVVPLREEDAAKMRLGWNSYFSRQTLLDHIRHRPSMAFMVEDTSDYLVGDDWRHRDEISHILETHGRRHHEALLDAFIDSCRARGGRLVLVSPEEHSDKPRAYRELGFQPIERVIYYEIAKLKRSYDVPRIETEPYLGQNFNALLDVDNRAFPWLWWNSTGEFEAYLSYPNVELFLTYDNNDLIGYYSISTFKGWGHLDRLAVVPEAQGRGYGAAQLAEAIRKLRDRGARRVTLTTQETNIRSRSLYESFGFDRPGGDYWLYGLWLDGTERTA